MHLPAQKIAIVGATGIVGQTLLHLLEQQNVPATQLTLLASARSAGKQIMYAGQALTIQDLTLFDFHKTQLAFFAAGSAVAEQYAPIAAAAGCIVIDKSAYYRLAKDIPLIVPEVNGQRLKSSTSKIISVPNCSTIQLVVALKPLDDLAILKRVEVATYQAVSGGGKKLIRQLRDELNPEAQASSTDKPPIAFNAIPAIDVLLASGFTKEENKMHEETQKILNSTVIVNATAVRIPVWQGHSEAVHIKTQRPLTLTDAACALKNFPGIRYCPEEIPTAVTHAAHNKDIWVGRLRRHPADSNHYLNFWVVSDNLYKGAAWNALQIALNLL